MDLQSNKSNSLGKVPKVALSIRWRPELKEAAKEASTKAGIPLNSFIEQAIQEKLERIKNPELVVKEATTSDEVVEAIKKMKSDLAALNDRYSTVAGTSQSTITLLKSIDTSLESKALSRSELYDLLNEIQKYGPKVEREFEQLLMGLANNIEGVQRGSEGIKKLDSGISDLNQSIGEFKDLSRDLGKFRTDLTKSAQSVSKKSTLVTFSFLFIMATALIATPIYFMPSPGKFYEACKAGVTSVLSTKGGTKK